MNIPEITLENNSKYLNFSFFKKGGMGEIYKGVNLDSQAEVVLKLILIENNDEKSLLKTEIRVSEQIVHENIAKTLGTGEITINGQNYFFIIQEYYPFGNLRSVIHEQLPIENCISMMLDILNGMEEIHKTIVHRDLKPKNILVANDGQLLLTDFGLAKYINEKTRTRSFKGAGTIPYMAPECWTGDANTLAMDIYSLGLIFFEIITGRLPANANTELEWREFHLFSQVPNIDSFKTGVTIKFNQIIQKMTNKRPSQRYTSVSQVIAAIKEAAIINATETSEAERLARLGNNRIQLVKAEELKATKEREKANEWRKILNYHIIELHSNIVEKVNAINDRLEDVKIKITDLSVSTISTASKFNFSFSGKSLLFSFIDSKLIEKYESEKKEQSLAFQRQRHDMIWQTPEPSYLKKNNVILIGLAETSFKIGNSEYGFNLILRQIDDSNYGEWYIMQFSRNISPPETSFGLDLSIFFNKYEEFRNSSFHTMSLRKITDQDITLLLEKIF